MTEQEHTDREHTDRERAEQKITENSDLIAPPDTYEEKNADEELLSKTRTDLLVAVSEKELRKLRARQRHNGSIWFGLGTFGMIGWSVAVPALIGIAAGLWLDRHWPTTFSWTLTLLFLGFGIGCMNAWYWVTRERHQIDRMIEGDSSDGGFE